MLNRFSIAALLLALMASTGQAASEPSQAADASQAQAAADPGPPESWPPAIRRFWEERAAETRRINGELWSIRVRLAGERLSKAHGQASKDLHIAYLQPAAPNYIRLRDGKTARTLEDIAASADGLTVLAGRVVSVADDGVMTFQPALKLDYGKAIKVNGLTSEQQARYKALIPNAGKPYLSDELHILPHAQVITRMETLPKAREVTYAIATLAEEPVTPQQLRMACRAYQATAIPDPWPIRGKDKPARTSDRTDNQLIYETKLATSKNPLDKLELENIRFGEALAYYAFTWSNRTLAIPPAAR